MTLTEYSYLINNNQPPVKESTMFDNFKASLQLLRDKLTLLWTKPTEFVDNSNELELGNDDYWAFEMYTGEWHDFDGELQPLKHTVIIEPHESTWMCVLDQILDAMNEHYGYDIKEQVYYSVTHPMNELNPVTGKPFPGYGRSLNDEKLQLLLLSHPELYESGPPFDRRKSV